jgi:hypothetical protein
MEIPPSKIRKGYESCFKAIIELVPEGGYWAICPEDARGQMDR